MSRSSLFLSNRINQDNLITKKKINKKSSIKLKRMKKKLEDYVIKNAIVVSI